jgi:NAD(P)-dependent dehydrogenase (short-subunit alcohol dehydrogenase family)
MYPDLEGKTALITGAGKKTGIGYAVAVALASAGVHVVIADLGGNDHEKGAVPTGAFEEMVEISESLSASFGVTSFPVRLDVTSTNAVNTMVKAITTRFEKVDILVNNAGAALGVPADIRNYDETAWLKTIDVNLHGVFRVSKAILPMMLGVGGSIINMSSRAGKVPPLFNGAYAVAKSGVIMLTKVMALELAASRVRVNAVCPGLIQTDMQTWRINLEADFFNTTFKAREEALSQRVPLGCLGSPEDVADLVVFLASRASAYITGQAINVDGGQTMAL